MSEFFTDCEGRIWPDARLAFDVVPSRRNASGCDFSVSREEMSLLRDVKNVSFRLYFLLQSREKWTALSLCNEFYRDNARSRFASKLSRHELSKALQSLWREGLVTLSIPAGTTGVIHVFSNFTGNHSTISNTIAAWVKYGHSAVINRSCVSKKIKDLVFSRDGRVCRTCGKTKDLTIDHIKPVILGGLDDLENLTVLCRSCNSKKNAKYDG